MIKKKSPHTYVDRPIFIVGPHRSGTTIFYKLLGNHPDVGYFTRFNKRIPDHPLLAHFLIRVFGRDIPKEAQPIWDRFNHKDCDIMDASDLKLEEARWYRKLVQRVLKIRKTNRFMAKYPRLSLRLSWINSIFPDCIFIHITRDWRAVVSSAVQRMVKRSERGGGWFGVRIKGWQEMQGMPHEYIAAEQFCVVTKTLEHYAEKQFQNRMFRVSYEQLCNDPRVVISQVAEQCDLRNAPGFLDTIPERLRCSNSKWQLNYNNSVYEDIRSKDPIFSRYEWHEMNSNLAGDD